MGNNRQTIEEPMLERATAAAVPSQDRNREIKELREKVEQAIVCINAALYVLLKDVQETASGLNGKPADTDINHALRGSHE
ncbi:hypothetical protein [Paraburkholderia phenoliruptrix]|uniref:hypothetical protein n=1 Tax=Paraburkholderia phenoliruptrix TaxID=252970 RepID=UPI003D960C9B